VRPFAVAVSARGVLTTVGAAALLVMAVAGPARGDPMSTSPEQAYDQGEIPNPRAVGMGGALNALGVSTAALSLNPANMALARVYHLEALAAYSPEAKRQTYGFAVVDSVINSAHIAGGVEGTWSEYDPSGFHRTWTDLRGGVAIPLGEYLALGGTLRWLRVNQDRGVGPFKASYASDGANGPLFNGLTLDAGATLSLLEGLRIAVVGHNLTNPGTALAPIIGAAGVGYFTPTFAIEGDGSLDFTTWGSARGRLMGGAELFLADRYALRAGWRYDAGTKINSPSLGFGYIDPHWSIELGLRRDLLSEHAETLGSLSIRYFYDSAQASPPEQNEILQ
jgi:hypothetical protein